MEKTLTAKIAYDDLIGIAITADNVRDALYSVAAVLDKILEHESEVDSREAIKGAYQIIQDQRAKLDIVSKGISEIEPEE